MSSNIDFSHGVRGKFYRADARLQLPVYLDDPLQDRLTEMAKAKGVDLSELVNDILRKDIDLIETAR